MAELNPRLGRTIAILAVATSVSACGYNTIPTQQERAEAAWADVQSQYQRRADLVPNLVAPETLSDPAAFQQFQEAQGALSSALSRLLVTVEAYPQIQSNQNFVNLQQQLEGTENRIAIARRDYNEAVREYNTTLRTFPNVIWANTVHSGSDPMQLFTATAEAQSAPSVEFNVGPTAPGAAPGGGAPAVAPGATPPAA